jgi:polyketide synthase 12
LIGELAEVRRALAGNAPADRDAEGKQAFLIAMAGLSARECRRALIELVSAHVAAVMGHSSSERIDVVRPFRELGFDSLMAVELRNRLQGATGMPLPSTIVFDHPSSVLLADHLCQLLDSDGSSTDQSVEGELVGLEVSLSSLTETSERERAAARLRELAARLSENTDSASAPDVAQRLESASDEEIFGFIETELGSL